MKILVIDDSVQHIMAAEEQLSVEHNLTTATSYDEAVALIKQGGWDAVLCDMNMPLEKLGETAVGWSLVFLAAKHGAKYVAMLTDASHHLNGDSASIDIIHREIFSVEGAKVLFSNNNPSCGKDWGWYLGVLTEENGWEKTGLY
jgi:CheY-like chemotaxis protein